MVDDGKYNPTANVQINKKKCFKKYLVRFNLKQTIYSARWLIKRQTVRAAKKKFNVTKLYNTLKIHKIMRHHRVTIDFCVNIIFSHYTRCIVELLLKLFLDSREEECTRTSVFGKKQLMTIE